MALFIVGDGVWYVGRYLHRHMHMDMLTILGPALHLVFPGSVHVQGVGVGEGGPACHMYLGRSEDTFVESVAPTFTSENT